MPGYLSSQIAAIRRAVVRGREDMHRRRSFEPIIFAQTFIAHEGVQIPGNPEAREASAEVARQVLSSLANGTLTSLDPTVAREVQRARTEAEWARHAESDKVVGFRLQLAPQAQRSTLCQALLNVDHGLGAAVYRKGEVVVLPPECDGSSFVPVSEDEVEQ
jgi:hypothetical protein